VASLIDGRLLRPCDPLRGVDPRWLDAVRAEIAGNVGRSRCTRTLMLDRIEARVEQAHGKGEVPIPKPTTARAVLAEVTRGTNAFTGSAKARRGIAARPPTPYGRFRPTRPGEYLILDTTRLDVFAMEPVTLCWVAAELTVAMDLYSRCIVAVQLTPVSTKAVDVAALMFEVICPEARARREGGYLPYAGVPSAVIVDPDKTSDRARLPAVFPDTVVVDHGKVYLSDHLRSVCSRFGISIQPARPRIPTDKAPLERFFRTLGEDLLAALPGYKGPDVHGRGSKEHVEDEAYYFLDELEQIIREWTAERYHRRVHHGIAEPQVPGLDYSPIERYEAGIARAGLLRVPARPDLAYDFLPVEWRTIQHYGVELNGLRYDGEGLNGHRDTKSPYTGVHAGDWPIRYDPDDVSRVFFQDPVDHTWHELRWVHADDVPSPFSREVLAYSRRLARKPHRFSDDRLALKELLERWDAGMASGLAERRMALRLSKQRADRLSTEETDGRDLSQLEVVRARQTKVTPADQRPPQGGDDDDAEELGAIAEDDGDAGDFYDDAY
jgi:transposase InsO family protein